MQDVMFTTMSEILSIDSDECRNAALHGLSHLHHPATLEQLRRHRPSIPDLETWCNEYHVGEAAWADRIQEEVFLSLTVIVKRQSLVIFAATGV